MKKMISLAVFLVMLLPAAVASGAAGEEPRSHMGGLNGTGTGSDPYRIGSYTDLMLVSLYHSYHSGAHYLQTRDIIFDDVVNGNVITMIVSLTDDTVVIELLPDASGGTGETFAGVSLNDVVTETTSDDGSWIAVFDDSVLKSKNSVVAAGSFEGNDFAAAVMFSEIDGTITITAPMKGNFEPIGTEEDPFTGFYDGNGYSIKGLKVVSMGSGEVAAGLFGYTDSATLCNIHIDSDAEHTSYVISSSVLSSKNSRADGLFTLASGGMVGVADGTTVIASSVNCSVSSFLLMISENENGSGVSTLTVDFDTASHLYTGGLIGYGDGSVYDSMNTGVISSTAFMISRTEYIERDTDIRIFLDFSSKLFSYSGGIVGRSGGSITIVNTGNTAPIYSSQHSSFDIEGEFDNYVSRMSIHIEVFTVTGGIAGAVDAGDILNTFNSGDLRTEVITYFKAGHSRSDFGHTTVYIGGSIGAAYGTLNIDNSHNVGPTHMNAHPYDLNAVLNASAGISSYDTHIKDLYSLSTLYHEHYIDEKNAVMIGVSEMSSADTFIGWDFDRVWVMSDLGYPVILIRYPVQIVDISYPFDGFPGYSIDVEHYIDDEGVLYTYTERTGFTFTLTDGRTDSDTVIYALHGERMIVLEADGEGRYRIPSPLLLDMSSGITLYVDITENIIPAWVPIPERLDEAVIAVIVSLAVAAAAVTILNIISAASVLSMNARAESEIRKEERE